WASPQGLGQFPRCAPEVAVLWSARSVRSELDQQLRPPEDPQPAAVLEAPDPRERVGEVPRVGTDGAPQGSGGQSVRLSGLQLPRAHERPAALPAFLRRR